MLANLLNFTGQTVTREYYINDAGAQVDLLARSAYLRYLQALGKDDITIAEGLYPGDYLVDVGYALKDKFGDRLKDAPESEWLDEVRSFTIAAMMEGIKADLEGLGIKMDLFSSEHALVSDGKVDETISALTDQGLVYRGVLEPPKGQL